MTQFFDYIKRIQRQITRRETKKLIFQGHKERYMRVSVRNYTYWQIWQCTEKYGYLDKSQPLMYDDNIVHVEGYSEFNPLRTK